MSFKTRLKNFFRMFKYSNIKEEAKRLGGNITMYNFIVTMFVVGIIAFIITYLLKLQLAYCVVVIAFFVLCTPSMIIASLKYSYERLRFDSVVSYLEQMIYNFRKSEKILTSLEDTKELLTGGIVSTIKKVINYINVGIVQSKDKSLYEEAFSLFEKDYNCTRIKQLHNFLVEVEQNGGEYKEALGILLQDIREWSQRVLEYQQNRRNIRAKVTISIVLAIGTCGAMLNLIPQEFIETMISQPVYHVVTTFVLLLCVTLFVMANNRLGGSYFDLEVEVEAEHYAMKHYAYLENYVTRKKVKPIIIKVLLVVPLVAVELYLNIPYLVVGTVGLAVLLLVQPIFKHNAAKKYIMKEIQRTFPDWIRGLIIHLQTNNVHVALKNSLPTAPAVLKPEIESLLVRIEEQPNSIEPYTHFLENYDLPELKSAVHFLYALSEFGTNDMLAQLNYLVEQNSELQKNAERIQNEDALAGMSIMILAPMLISVIKLMLDMVLLLGAFMNYITFAY